MTTLRVDPAVLARFPGVRLAVVVAEGIDNQTERPEVTAELERAWAAASRDVLAYRNPQSHPRVRLWREAFTAAGISNGKFPSSIEALLRRAAKGGPPPHVNPLVDFATTVSVRHVVPVGAFDLDAVHGDIALRLTDGREPFHALDADTPVAVEPGEVAYTDDHSVLTRHFVWRQSRAGLITHATQRVLLVSEILAGVSQPVAQAVLAHLQVGLRREFGVDSAGRVLATAGDAAR